VISAPESFTRRLKYLGPGVLVAGTVVGSGELILTSSLGAAAGFGLLWFLLLACWSKSIVQAGLAKLCMLRNATFLNVFNDIPGSLPGRYRRGSWVVWFFFLAGTLTIAGVGGILGGAARAVNLIDPDISTTVAATVIAAICSIVVGAGSYRLLESLLVLVVSLFTAISMYCAIALQFTEYSVSLGQVVAQQTLHIDTAYLALAAAVFGYTGVNSNETIAYSYFVLDKGYARNVGETDSPEGVERAQGWLRVLRADVWLTLVLLTLSTVPFFFLGAGVLHEMGQIPENSNMLTVISAMYTEVLGAWAADLFIVGAFLVLFSTVIGALAADCRLLPDYLIETGFLRNDPVVRRRWVRASGYLYPFLYLGILLYFDNPLMLVIVGALFTAFLGPVLILGILYIEKTRIEPALRSGLTARILMYLALLLVSAVSVALLYFALLST
jgi:Mn2+/Fe2+ NRAMP family transporter